MSTETPDFAAARDHVVGQVVDLARRLRADGADVAANAPLVATEALVETGLDDRDRVRAAMHATLVTDPRDSETFAEHFPGFWYRLRSGLEATATRDDVGDRADQEETAGGMATDVDGALAGADVEAALEGTGDLTEADGETRVESRRVAETEGDEADHEATDRRPGTYSKAGRRHRVGDETAGVEQVDADALSRFERALATLPGRRWEASPGGVAVDGRRALRESLSTGGVAVSLPRRDRDRTAFRTCVLVDVSRSVLDAVDRGFLLSFVDALVADGRSVRAFFFDTDVREVTGTFVGADRDPAAALERAEVAWGGGTRIGGSLAALRERWPHAVDRRTVAIVVSDGLEVGEVPELEREAAWLARRSGGVVWLNPLATSAAFEPTSRGMAAALPFVDGLFAFGGNRDLTEVARQLERQGPSGTVGYEYDFRDRGGVSTG